LQVIEDVFSRLGVVSGPFDCDFVADGERIVLIEITPRLGGNSLSRLYKTVLDFDLVAYAVSHACGDDYSMPASARPAPAAIAILGVDENGLLSWNEQEAELLRQEPWVDNLLIDLAPGTAVQPFINGRHRVGEALVIGRNRDEVDGRLVELKRRLALKAG
jgi:biotin carboxylase